MLRRTRFSVCFETALCLAITFHVLNPLVYRLNQTGAAQALQKAPGLRQVILKLKSKRREMAYGCTQKVHDAWKQAHTNLFWSVDTLQQPRENDGLGCTYKFKEAKATRNLGF
jgi:hypothetical protein